MRLNPKDFLIHGYTAGCAGCEALRRKTGERRNHSGPCRLRMETALNETAEGRARKDREAARREEELTEALMAEDAKIRREEELNDEAAAKNNASAQGSTIKENEHAKYTSLKHLMRRCSINHLRRQSRSFR